MRPLIPSFLPHTPGKILRTLREILVPADHPLREEKQRSNTWAPYLSTEEFPEHGQRNKQPTRPPQQSLSTLISYFGNSSVHQPFYPADSLFALRKANPNPVRDPPAGWLNGVALERERDMASCGAGVAILFAHVTSRIGSPTRAPESGRSIKRHPNLRGVRFRKVRAKYGKRQSYNPGMHGYSASCSHTHDAK